jgi:hypothetical protein
VNGDRREDDPTPRPWQDIRGHSMPRPAEKQRLCRAVQVLAPCLNRGVFHIGAGDFHANVSAESLIERQMLLKK